MSYRLNGIPNKIFKEFSDHPKISMEPQKILNCQSYLEKRKEKLMAPPGQFQIYSKLAVIKTVRHRRADIRDRKNRHID